MRQRICACHLSKLITFGQCSKHEARRNQKNLVLRAPLETLAVRRRARLNVSLKMAAHRNRRTEADAFGNAVHRILCCFQERSRASHSCFQNPF